MSDYRKKTQVGSVPEHGVPIYPPSSPTPKRGPRHRFLYYIKDFKAPLATHLAAWNIILS